MQRQEGHGGKYGRFLLMVLTSTVLMHLLTYTNVFSAGHIRFSATRLYLSLIMGSTMAVVMLAFMRHMYRDRAKNIAIVAVSAVIFVAALLMMRAQTFVGDAAWMRAMIPHHSIAVLTSRNADIRDPEVRALADEIIRTQLEEIAEMEALLQKVTR
ncbi:MAG TPA: DUF305 domain-containing protein [Candidatus Limnocylindria bacterium]|nr:DUF305 domain-containing protein [Candidatus Limnocylindria bacterium]